MIAFFFVLNQEVYLEEILEAFLELNIAGATVLDSVGMGSILSKDIPIFAGFRNLFQGTESANKTILAIVEKERVPEIVKAIEQVVGPLEEPGNGLAFTIPVGEVYGLRKGF